jgi:hypothetical protein
MQLSKSSLPLCWEGGTRRVTGGGVHRGSPSVSFAAISPVKGEETGLQT